MKNSNKNYIILFLVFPFLINALVACKNNNNADDKKETIISGSTTIVVDETLQPIMEDQIAVFENQYPVKIKQINASENEVISKLTTQEHAIALMGRELTADESAVFRNKKIKARTTAVAIDAIALITNSLSKDTLVDLDEVIKLMQNKPSKVSNLVFENSNSSTVSYMSRLAGIDKMPTQNIYSLVNVNEVFEYIAKNPNKIGVVGLNVIVQPTPAIKLQLEKIKVMAVRNVKTAKNNVDYYKPSQDNLGAVLYPLSRKIYMLNYQGGAGLGMGFASFVAGDIGQRIILKSGLLPISIPSRSMQIRKGIINKQ